MKSNFLEAIIGFIVLIVSALFIYFAYVSSGEKIKDGYILYAKFEDVTGLSSGADVKLNGIKVGIVKSLTLDHDYAAKAVLLIQNKYKIPEDSALSISTDGIMGNKFVAISVGFSNNHYTAGSEVEETKSSLNLEKLVDKFVANIGQNKQEGKE